MLLSSASIVEKSKFMICGDEVYMNLLFRDISNGFKGKGIEGNGGSAMAAIVENGDDHRVDVPYARAKEVCTSCSLFCFHSHISL